MAVVLDDRLMTIRLAAPSDAEAIAAVNVASWQAA